MSVEYYDSITTILWVLLALFIAWLIGLSGETVHHLRMQRTVFCCPVLDEMGFSTYRNQTFHPAAFYLAAVARAVDMGTTLSVHNSSDLLAEEHNQLCSTVEGE